MYRNVYTVPRYDRILFPRVVTTLADPDYRLDRKGGGGGGTVAEIWGDTLRWSSRRTSSIEKEAYYQSMNHQALSSSSNMRSASSLLPLKMVRVFWSL
ncbi:hypothetical protein EMCRGX_G019824 [Ephydatia muelleri]